MSFTKEEDQAWIEDEKRRNQQALAEAIRETSSKNGKINLTWTCSKYSKHHHHHQWTAQLCGKVQWATITLVCKCPTS